MLFGHMWFAQFPISGSRVLGLFGRCLSNCIGIFGCVGL